MPGAAMVKVRGSYSVRSAKKTKLLPARHHSMKVAGIPELRFTMQIVPRQPRHGYQVARSPITSAFGGLNDGLENFSTFLSVYRSQRKRARRVVSPSRRVKVKAEHRGSLCQEQSTLPESTWCMIQDMITNAKSLGDITRITLTFFKEHEIIRSLVNSEFSPVFPIVIPASEVYNMLGIGVIKRVRGDDASGAKGGSFLYFGKEAAIQHLAKIQQRAAHTVENLSQRQFEVPAVEEVDIALLKMCEDQAEIERWPCLTTTTTSFLSLLLQQDIDQALALPGISSRLVEAKRNRDPNFTNESAHADVNRRVYDVVSVLASCNLVLISVAPGASDEREDSLDKISSRKHVRFNYTIFEDPSSLKIADVSARKLSIHLETEKLRLAVSAKRSKKLIPPKNRRINKGKNSAAKSRLAFHEVDPLAEADIPTKPEDWMPAVDTFGSQMENESPLRIDLGSIPAVGDDYIFEYHIETPPCKRKVQSVREELKLESFCPIIKAEPQGPHDWWDDSLQELLFQDALPSQDLLDWELMMANKVKEEGEVWGQVAPNRQLGQTKTTHPRFEALDLTCYEDFEDDDHSTEGYFAVE